MDSLAPDIVPVIIMREEFMHQVGKMSKQGPGIPCTLTAALDVLRKVRK